MKFSLRDLFLVTVIIALALGWWLERRAYVGMNEWLLQRGTRYRGMVQQYEDALIDIRGELPASVKQELPPFLNRAERDPPRDRWPDSRDSVLDTERGLSR